MDRLSPGVLILPDGGYPVDEQLAKTMRAALRAAPYLDAMGFDSYHEPVWPDDEQPPKAFKTFRYLVVVRMMTYFFRRKKENAAPISAYKLRPMVRKYMENSATLRPLAHPQATYGELTLAAIISGFRVEINNKLGAEADHPYSPIIYLGGFTKGYEYRGTKTK
jgi:hypothetical protein